MNIDYTIDKTIGKASISWGGATCDVRSGTSDLSAFRDFITSAEICGLVVTFPVSEQAVADCDVEALVHLLDEATVPTAAVFSGDNKETIHAAAHACDYQFTAKKGDATPLENQAAKYLHHITDRRPVHVIRSVMSSINNSESLSAREALLKETQLFCRLSAENASNRTSAKNP